MIRTEIINHNGVDLVKTYSDDGRYVVRNSISYHEAIDPTGSSRTYIEGDIIHPRYGGSQIEQEVIMYNE